MSRKVLIPAAVTALLAATAPAPADTGPNLSATPATVRFGHVQTIRGSEWPVIEFCSRTVRLALLRPQQSHAVGLVKTRTNGTWSFKWTPHHATVAGGRWTLRARMKCESGKDGSTIWVKAFRRVRIVP